MLELKESLFPVVVDIVGDRRSAQLNRFFQHFLHGDEKFPELFRSNCGGPSSRTDAGAEQRFVGINISHAPQQLLIEQRAFDGSLATAKQPDEPLKVNIKGLDAPGIKIRRNAQPPKAPRIDEPQLPP